MAGNGPGIPQQAVLVLPDQLAAAGELASSGSAQ